MLVKLDHSPKSGYRKNIYLTPPTFQRCVCLLTGNTLFFHVWILLNKEPPNAASVHPKICHIWQVTSYHSATFQKKTEHVTKIRHTRRFRSWSPKQKYLLGIVGAGLHPPKTPQSYPYSPKECHLQNHKILILPWQVVFLKKNDFSTISAPVIFLGFPHFETSLTWPNPSNHPSLERANLQITHQSDQSSLARGAAVSLKWKKHLRLTVSCIFYSVLGTVGFE